VTNPIGEFLKIAAEINVKRHTRTVDGEEVVVEAHQRTIDVAPDKLPVTDVKDRQAKDLEAWQKWVDGGKKHEDLRPLLRRFEPMLHGRLNVYKGKVQIPDTALELAFRTELARAMHEYDPDRGAALGTFVYRSLTKGRVQRWVGENQNVGRIPENRLYKIRKFQTVIGELQNELGKTPTDEQIGERLEWGVPEVLRMRKELRSDLVAQNFEENPFTFTSSKNEEIMRLFKYELQGEQLLVYQHLMGYGKPQIKSTKELSKKLKMNDYQVSRIKTQIATKLKRHLDDDQQRKSV
jgi:DNA-directed RNA polymerase specialized sigma subunit